MLALYDPETVRNKKQTSYSRLKTSVRLFFDRKMRSRNLKARNDMIHGVVTRSRKEIKANVQLDNVLKETRVVSIMELELLVTGANFLNKKSGRPRLHQIRRQPKTERDKSSDEKDGKSFDKRNKIPCQWRNCTNPSCSYRHPVECQNYISQIGCRYGKTCFFRHVELAEKPNKKSKKRGANGSVAS